MRCIFCKCSSSSSTSKEHIIPESFGNTQHTLPRGVVCDKCNNYIARKVEKPLLDSLYFKEQRFRMSVPSKRNKIPKISGLHLQSRTLLELSKHQNENIIDIVPAEGEDESQLVKFLKENKEGTLIIPISPPHNDYIISRFVAKIGLEVLASRFITAGGLDELIDKPELDDLRSYVRHGNPRRIWPYSYRSIYAPDSLFTEKDDIFEVLHEYDILVTRDYEYYVVVAIFGIEYALNLGRREIDGYYDWLSNHNYQSPLYFGKNSRS